MAIMLLIVDCLQCCILVKMERFIFKSYTLIPNIIFSYPFLKIRIEFLNSDASSHCSLPRTQSTSQRAWASPPLLPCWHMTFVSSEFSKVCWSRLSKKQIPRPKMGLSVQEFYKGTCRFDPVGWKGQMKVSHTVLQPVWDYTKPKPLGFLLKPKWAVRADPCLPGYLVSPSGPTLHRNNWWKMWPDIPFLAPGFVRKEGQGCSASESVTCSCLKHEPLTRYNWLFPFRCPGSPSLWLPLENRKQLLISSPDMLLIKCTPSQKMAPL